MNLAYIFAELSRRPARALMAALSLALGVALFVSLQAYADGYRQAARAPLAEVGADLAAQRQGAVPEKFEGVVFPHSVAPIHRDEIDRIRGLPGVRAVAEVMFFWSFEPNGFVAGLGLDPSDTFGPGRLMFGARPTRPDDLRELVPDVAAARRDLGFEARTPFADGLARTVAWARARLTAPERHT